MYGISFRKVTEERSEAQTYPCPLRVICIAISQVNSVIRDSWRCIPSRQKPICKISSLFEEDFIAREIVSTKKPTQNSE